MTDTHESNFTPLNKENIQMFVIDACGGEPEIALEMVDFFLSSADNLLGELATHLSTGNMPEARRAAHSLKSGSRMFGADTLSHLCLRAEKSAEEDDSVTVAELLPQIQTQVAWLHSELPVVFRAMLGEA